jgi:hypothetical protein
MKKKHLLNGSYWFTMYTTYFAILSLLFYILENPHSATAKGGILKDALEGRNALAGLAKRSMAADRCTQSLNVCCFYISVGERFGNHLDVFGLTLCLRLFSSTCQRSYGIGRVGLQHQSTENGLSHIRHPHRE